MKSAVMLRSAFCRCLVWASSAAEKCSIGQVLKLNRQKFSNSKSGFLLINSADISQNREGLKSKLSLFLGIVDGWMDGYTVCLNVDICRAKVCSPEL